VHQGKTELVAWPILAGDARLRQRRAAEHDGGGGGETGDGKTKTTAVGAPIYRRRGRIQLRQRPNEVATVTKTCHRASKR